MAPGMRMYREGILPSGQPMQATLQNGLTLSGAQAACVTCHRRSGFGGSEGRTSVPAIAAPAIFTAANAPHHKMYQSVEQGPGTRPAYTDVTLAVAIRDGIDAMGRTMVAPMPRYRLSDQDMQYLAAYLKQLSAQPSPGVTDSTIHFATVVTPDADPAARKAMQDVLGAFFRDKNAGTRQETLRAERATWEMERVYKAYRRWQLHIWELKGTPDTWPAQLDRLYREQPVFALLSGMAAHTWQPVHDFCERNEMPCLFPNAGYPAIAGPDYYSLYFSQGVTLEAQSLAKYLAGDTAAERENGLENIVQVYRDDDMGRQLAGSFRKAMADNGIAIVNHAQPADAPITPTFWQGLVASTRPSQLVLWLGQKDLGNLDAIAEAGFDGQLYLSSTQAGDFRLPTALRDSTYLTYPYELPQALNNRLIRVRMWLKARSIPPGDERIQANTYFAATQAGEAAMHLVDHFSRDYFIERIEHGLDNALTSSVYPHLSLGPGQRFASKGCYIVKYSDASGSLTPVSNWIVP